MSLILKIDKLRGSENYIGWSKKVRLYFVEAGLWNALRSATFSNERKLKRAKFILLCLIDYNLFELIEPDATPHSIWTTLQSKCTKADENKEK